MKGRNEVMEEAAVRRELLVKTPAWTVRTSKTKTGPQVGVAGVRTSEGSKLARAADFRATSLKLFVFLPKLSASQFHQEQ